MEGRKEEKGGIKGGSENYTDYLSATIRKGGYRGKELSGDNDGNLRTRGGKFLFFSFFFFFFSLPIVSTSNLPRQVARETGSAMKREFIVHRVGDKNIFHIRIFYTIYCPSLCLISLLINFPIPRFN